MILSQKKKQYSLLIRVNILILNSAQVLSLILNSAQVLSSYAVIL